MDDKTKISAKISKNTCTELLIQWFLYENLVNSADKNDANLLDNINKKLNENDISFINKVLIKKLEDLNINIKLPPYLPAIIEVCTNYNPELSQVMLKEILDNINNLTEGYYVTSEDFIRVYSNEFPIVDIDEWNNHFKELWGKQKLPNGKNLCDTREWWIEIFN